MSISGPASAYLSAIPGISPYPKMTTALWTQLPTVNSGGGSNALFAVIGPDGNHQFQTHFAGSPPNSMGCNVQGTNGTMDISMAGVLVNPTNWHHVLVTCDDGGVPGQVATGIIYIDGVQKFTAGGPITGFGSNDALSSNYVFPGNPNAGAIVDYPAIWKRILTQTEITALAANGDPRTVAPAGLVLFSSLNSTPPIADLVTPAIIWTMTGVLSVTAPPFSLAAPPVVPPVVPPPTGSNIYPPFMPVKFPPGPPTAQKNVWEDGPGAYVDATGTPIRYTGQNQTTTINIRIPKPV